MRGLPDKDTQYSGSDCHRYVDALIRGSGDLDIVSPYISAGYASALARHSRGNRVRVITSAARQNAGAMKVFGRSGTGWLKSAGFLAALSLISAALGLWYALALLAAMAALAGAAAAFSISRGNPRLIVKVSTRVFVHEKLYICSGAAISGSANLTFSGMHRNLEHLDISVSRERVAYAERHFGELWASI